MTPTATFPQLISFLSTSRSLAVCYWCSDERQGRGQAAVDVVPVPMPVSAFSVDIINGDETLFATGGSMSDQERDKECELVVDLVPTRAHPRPPSPSTSLMPTTLCCHQVVRSSRVAVPPKSPPFAAAPTSNKKSKQQELAFDAVPCACPLLASSPLMRARSSSSPAGRPSSRTSPMSPRTFALALVARTRARMRMAADARWWGFCEEEGQAVASPSARGCSNTMDEATDSGSTSIWVLRKRTKTCSGAFSIFPVAVKGPKNADDGDRGRECKAEGGEEDEGAGDDTDASRRLCLIRTRDFSGLSIQNMDLHNVAVPGDNVACWIGLYFVTSSDEQVRQLMGDRRRLMGDLRHLMAQAPQIRTKRRKDRRMSSGAGDVAIDFCPPTIIWSRPRFKPFCRIHRQQWMGPSSPPYFWESGGNETHQRYDAEPQFYELRDLTSCRVLPIINPVPIASGIAPLAFPADYFSPTVTSIDPSGFFTHPEPSLHPGCVCGRKVTASSTTSIPTLPVDNSAAPLDVTLVLNAVPPSSDESNSASPAYPASGSNSALDLAATRWTSTRKRAEAEPSVMPSNKRWKKLDDPLDGWVMQDLDTGKELTGKEWVERYLEEFKKCYKKDYQRYLDYLAQLVSDS
ncbi:hypothetical protein K438DRAFT_1771635 [Mycena galopus ATCC 62051]|nr:hypothetical protein K438DRAFT_1771635 [Mycena galopus ATCC 62051]